MSGLWTACVSGTALILAAALVRALGGKHLPRALFPALWCAAAVRLLLPVALPSSLSIWNLLPRGAAVPLPAMRTSLGTAAIAAAPVTDIAHQTAAVAGKHALNAPLLVWAAGAALLTSYFLIGYLRFAHRFSGAEAASCPELDALAARLHVRSVPRVRLADDGCAPLTYGVLRPVILLPRTLLQDEDTRCMVLAHELAHIRRRDCLRKQLLTACLCVYWWNPACWLMRVLADRDIELACDAHALRALGPERRKCYALALLQLAAHQTRPHPLGSCFGRPAAEARIRAILRARRVPAFAAVLAALLAGSLVTAFATQAKPVPVQHEMPAAVETVSAQEPVSEAEPPIPASPEPEQGPESLPEEQAVQFSFPLDNTAAPVTDGYGYKKHPITGKETFHPGLDFDEAAGREIYAVGAGTVTTAEYNEVWGYYAVIDHGDGYQSLYAHMPSLQVEAGQTVEQGEVIGVVGSTGWATGPHLHLSIYKNGETVDPMTVLG